jgi:hypothetical protein
LDSSSLIIKSQATNFQATNSIGSSYNYLYSIYFIALLYIYLL